MQIQNDLYSNRYKNQPRCDLINKGNYWKPCHDTALFAVTLGERVQYACLDHLGHITAEMTREIGVPSQVVVDRIAMKRDNGQFKSMAIPAAEIRNHQ